MEILPDIRWRGVSCSVYWESVTNRWYALNRLAFKIRIILFSSGTLQRRTANFCTRVASNPVLPERELTGLVNAQEQRAVDKRAQRRVQNVSKISTEMLCCQEMLCYYDPIL